MGKRWKTKITYVILMSMLALSLAGCGNTEEDREVMAGIGQDIEEPAGKNTEEPVVPPTEAPEAEQPTEVPTEAPTPIPTEAPTAVPTVQPTEAPPTEEEINEFLASHYEELEHEMTLALGETGAVVPYKILSGVVWKSQDESIAVVQDGVVYALKPGKSLLTANAGAHELYCNVEVTGYKDMKLAVNCSRTLPVNDKIGSLRLETENPEILEATDNRLTAKAAGRCQVTAYVNEEPYAFYIVVTDPQLSQTTLTKIVGTEEKLYVFGTPSTVVWKSDNEAIATVSADGVVTGAPGGINQTTTIRAQVDGAELNCQITVEAIPQLSTSYRIYGYSTDTDENGAEIENKIVLYANANEICESGNNITYLRESVISMSSAKFTSNSYPVYYTYGNEAVSRNVIAEEHCAHTQIYMLGTSQNAHVMVRDSTGGEVSNGTMVTYTPMEGFGIIDVYIDMAPEELEGELIFDEMGQEKSITYRIGGGSLSSTDCDDISYSSLKRGDTFQFNKWKILSYHLGEAEYQPETKTIKKKITGTVYGYNNAGVRVYVEIGGFTYQMYVAGWNLGIYNPSVEIPSKFYIDDDAINADQYDTQIVQSEQVQRAGSNSSFRSNSDSFISGDWVDKMKDKVIDAVEDKAIDMAVSLLFKLIFF